MRVPATMFGLLVALGTATVAESEAPGYTTLRLSDQFWSEGAYYGDFNRDGKPDVVSGPFWWAGPDFQQRHEYRPAQAYDPKAYSDNFLIYVADFNGDGWDDILCVPHPGQAGYWYENPGSEGEGKAGHWKQHLAHENIGNESPVWGDVNGDGRPDLVFNIDGYLGYATFNPEAPEKPWAFTAVSPQDKRYQRYTHGVGLGDVNGDGRADLVESIGWWEQPAEPKPGEPWTFHPQKFAEAAAQLLVYDVDDDGLNDVITSWHCHQYGLLWYRQVRQSDGSIGWEANEILSPKPDPEAPGLRISQMHAFDVADFNGDGLQDFVTGKRFWAHGPTGDVEPNAPAVVYWFELRREGPGKARFVPHQIDDDSGVGTQVAATDLNGDGRPDVVVGNKKGVYVHLSQPAGEPAPAGEN